MKLTLTLILTAIGIFGAFKLLMAFKPVQTNPAISNKPSSVLNQCILKINSQDSLCLNEFKGKKILIVNVASQCGFTKQYSDLETLYQSYKGKLVIIGFPCNQFGGQESGTEEEILQFCSSKYSVTFPITTKIDVKGNNQHPIYKWLTNKSENGISDHSVGWNFNKFLLDENGQLIVYFGSRVNPLLSSIVNLLK